jgi:hypothetical protein
MSKMMILIRMRKIKNRFKMMIFILILMNLNKM